MGLQEVNQHFFLSPEKLGIARFCEVKLKGFSELLPLSSLLRHQQLEMSRLLFCHYNIDFFVILTNASLAFLFFV